MFLARMCFLDQYCNETLYYNDWIKSSSISDPWENDCLFCNDVIFQQHFLFQIRIVGDVLISGDYIGNDDKKEIQSYLNDTCRKWVRTIGKGSYRHLTLITFSRYWGFGSIFFFFGFSSIYCLIFARFIYVRYADGLVQQGVRMFNFLIIVIMASLYGYDIFFLYEWILDLTDRMWDSFRRIDSFAQWLLKLNSLSMAKTLLFFF